MPTINSERLLDNLHRLARIGQYKSGVHRPTYSPRDMEARHWLAERMIEAKLDPVIDGVGNVIGRSQSRGPRLLLGSHIETQPYAGWLDGSLGVMYGLEIARAFSEDPACANGGIDVVAWADEEGHYLSCLGSRAFCDESFEIDAESIVNRETGISLAEALARASLIGRPLERLEPTYYVGYMEGHIEQGDYLDTSKLRLGIVTAIVGIYQYRIDFIGEQNHAGTTRMAVRKDAGVALVRLCNAIEQQFPEVAGPRSVWTTGRMRLEPGAPSVVPGFAEMYFQFRDSDPSHLRAMEERLEIIVADSDRMGPCACRLETVSRVQPMSMSASFQAALERSAQHHAPGLHMRMPSAAGHDAQILGQRMDAAMLFVPSIGGISHHYEENTSDEDIVLGCQVMADAAADILHSAKKS